MSFKLSVCTKFNQLPPKNPITLNYPMQPIVLKQDPQKKTKTTHKLSWYKTILWYSKTSYIYPNHEVDKRQFSPKILEWSEFPLKS